MFARFIVNESYLSRCPAANNLLLKSGFAAYSQNRRPLKFVSSNSSFPLHMRVYNRNRKHWFALFVCKLEVLMNVHISYRLHKSPAVEKDIQHHIEKLRKRLQVFRPELVHLKGMVEEVSAREGISVSLNLRLPSGQMAAQTTAASAAAAVKTAFEDLLQQLNK